MMSGIADMYRPYFTHRYRGLKVEQGLVLRKRGVHRSSERVIERNKVFSKIATSCREAVSNLPRPQKGIAYQICVALRGTDASKNPEVYQKWKRELEAFNRKFGTNLSF